MNGKTINIVTQEVTQARKSRTGQMAKVAGGTAAGAGAGGAVQRVKIPSETRLTFTLQQPLKI